ncbi:MAG: penicillin-binding protein 1C [Bacteroidota bacterium]|jgi:penicillin-binding protein 1C
MVRPIKNTTLLIIVFLGLIAGGTIFIPLPREPFKKEVVESVRVVDRTGLLLRELLNDQQGRGHWRSLDTIASSFLQATIAIEDKRFNYHPGVDPLAVVRALSDDIKSWSIRSGGSTLTQQVIRNVYHSSRTPWYKIVEAWYALRLERMMSKREILEQYVNRAPYGNQLYGVESAARAYFGKTANDLSLAESAFLAALPNAPTLLNPYQNLPVLIQRQRLVLRRMLEQERVGSEEYERAIVQPLRILSREANFRAPHAVELVLRTVDESHRSPLIETTIDYALQEDVHFAVKARLSALKKKNVTNAAVIVIDNQSREIRVLLGSADYFDEGNQGQVNGALALRQPGSALKPFLYGVALESGYSPASILPDVPTQISDEHGAYVPENYDKRYHGPVRLRTALACSYNIPAVRVLNSLGIEPLLQRLHEAGFVSLNKPASYYGCGLVLGDGEVTLLELTNAYAALANGGVWKPAKLIRSLDQSVRLRGGSPFQERVVSSVKRIFEDRTIFLLSDILSDRAARRPAFGNAFRFPFPCAVKTGTTKDYRDNWTVGFTTLYTVGVWVGNFDGSPMRGVSGVTGAGQIFFDVMSLLHRRESPDGFTQPKGLHQVLICPLSGKLPGEACRKTILEWFKTGEEPRDQCSIHRLYRIVDRGKEMMKVYDIVPPEFRTWAEQERIPALPPNASPEQNPRSSEHSNLRGDKGLSAILYPLEGDHFKIDPVLRSEYQSIKVLGTAPEKVDSVLLRIDRERVPFNPSGTWWTLRPGKHVMQIEAMLGNKKHLSEPISFEVE